jgi:hypothetical protein
LEEGRTLGEVADAIVATHDVSREVAFRDIVDLVSHMNDQALLTLI